MSFKSNHLAYSQIEPAFLKRIRGQIRDSVDDPDKHTNPPVIRPTISTRLKREDEDDAPVYVLEQTNQDLSKEAYEALLKGEEAGGAEETAEKTTDEVDSNILYVKHKGKAAGIGGLLKKRKAAKIIGQDDHQGAGPIEAETREANTKSTKGMDMDAKKAPKKKKAKAVKLSFSDEEEP